MKECPSWIRTGVQPDLKDKAGCVSYMHQRRTPHIMTKCIEINVTIIINVVIT
jgi:hypothetical protein